MDSTFSSVLLALATGLGGTVTLLTPGYVLGSVYSRGIRGPAVSDRAFAAVGALGGLITHLMGSFWTIHLVRRVIASGVDQQAWELVAWATVILLVLPAGLGGALGVLAEGRVPFTQRVAPGWILRLLGNLGLSVSARTAEAWNWTFHRRLAAWVRVHLKGDQGIILGKFGKDSFASSDATLRDIYLQELWVADEDGWFLAPYPTSVGVWISGDEISSIEFLEGREESSGNK